MKRITIKNNAKIIDNKYVIKKDKEKVLDTYKYLISRSFEYFPKIIKKENEEVYYEYIEDTKEPNENKIIDLIYILILLHSKTTIYKEVDIDYYKEIYESTINIIEDTFNYYNDLLNIINSITYMSPSNYLIARNITIIFNALIYAKENIDAWYQLVENKRKVRVATIHNKLSLDHYLKNNKSYLISWNNSKEDMPLYDIVSLYKNHYLDFDFTEILKIYFNKYPYTEDEMLLFLTKISIPDKIKYNKSEYITVTNIRKVLDYIYKTRSIIDTFDLKKDNIKK